MTEEVKQQIIDIIIRSVWLFSMGVFILVRPNFWALDVLVRERPGKMTHKGLSQQLGIPLLLFSVSQALRLLSLFTGNERFDLLVLIPLSLIVFYYIFFAPSPDS